MPSQAEKQTLIAQGCWLCERSLGSKIQWHHWLPKSRGGNETVPVHPICHKMLHVSFTNTELERFGQNVHIIRQEPAIAQFLQWIRNKKPDFNAPVRRSRTKS